uniref:Uncharacterized protein n=1 Tax=Arundo donax TaxID=35708 RepID=A0A0A8ZIX4_ARUDO
MLHESEIPFCWFQATKVQIYLFKLCF